MRNCWGEDRSQLCVEDEDHHHPDRPEEGHREIRASVLLGTSKLVSRKEAKEVNEGSEGKDCGQHVDQGRQ